MRHRQVSVRRLAEQLPIIHEMMDNQLSTEEDLHTVDQEIVDTNSTCLSCGLLSRAPATERRKSG